MGETGGIGARGTGFWRRGTGGAGATDRPRPDGTVRAARAYRQVATGRRQPVSAGPPPFGSGRRACVPTDTRAPASHAAEDLGLTPDKSRLTAGWARMPLPNRPTM